MGGIAHCVVAGGNGQVGRMFSSKLANSGIEVTLVDIDFPVVGSDLAHESFEQGDITTPRGQVALAVAGADLVLLAVPEHVALAAVPPLAAIMQRGALLVDTLSVKSRIAALVRNEAYDLEAVSLNPMFAPSLGMAGRPIAVVTLADGPRARVLRKLLTSWGARVISIEAAEHDRVSAALQVATHSAVLAFGVALQNLDIDITDLYTLAPPPHLTLLAILARVVSGTPEVYWDIQAGNPEAPAARAALQRGIEYIATLADNGNKEGFATLLADMQTLLGDKRAVLVDVCAQIFDRLPLTLNADGDGAG